MVQLKHWFVVFLPCKRGTPREERLQALQGDVYGHEEYPDGTWIMTFAITAIDKRIVTTSNGRRYELVGEPSEEYMQWLVDECGGYDENDPCKLKDPRL